MNHPKGKLIAIGGAEDKGTNLETGDIYRNNLIFLSWAFSGVWWKKPAGRLPESKLSLLHP
jgi:hypothetical protein